MSKKIFLVSAIVLISGIITLSGCSHHPFMHFMHSSPEKRAGMIVDKISDELDLNSSQKAKLNQIKDEVIAKHKSKRNQFEDAFNFLQSEITKDKMDESLLKQKLNEFNADRDEMQSFMVSKLIEFHSILTKEQKETLAKKMTEIKEKFHSMD